MDIQELDGEAPDEGGKRGRPTGEALNSLGAVRKRLAKVIRDFENKKPVEKIEIDRLRALVYAFGTLGSIVKDETLDSIMERVTALETKSKETMK